MSYKKIKIKKDRSEWLKQRDIGIGGSDAGIVCNLNPYKSPYTLWAEKTGQVENQFKGNEKTRLGIDLEDYVAQRFCEETGKKVRRSNYMYQSVENPFMIANVDRLIIGEDAGLECKTAGQLSDYDFRNGEIPPSYYVQCQHYMAVLGLKKMYIAILQFQEGLFWFEIERNDDEIIALIENERDFWDLVQNKIPPTLDWNKSTGETLNFIHPANENHVADGSLIDLNLSTFEKIDSIDKEIKQLENEKELLKNSVKVMMGDCVKCKNESYSITYKEVEKTLIDTGKVRRLYPDVANECAKMSVSRPLYIHKTKVKK